MCVSATYFASFGFGDNKRVNGKCSIESVFCCEKSAKV